MPERRAASSKRRPRRRRAVRAHRGSLVDDRCRAQPSFVNDVTQRGEILVARAALDAKFEFMRLAQFTQGFECGRRFTSYERIDERLNALGARITRERDV